jgi:hypothetical protein
MKNFLKSWEIVLILVGMFFITSTSLYWYERISKTRPRAVEDENRKTWEASSQKWQKDATNNINGLRQSQQQVLDVLNANISTGRLIMPQVKK